MYETWCETHPLTVPKWKRGENARLIKTEEQLDAAAAIYHAAWQQMTADTATQAFRDAHTVAVMREELEADRKNGWALYLHTTAGQPDGLVGVLHKTGEVGRLYVAPAAPICMKPGAGPILSLFPSGNGAKMPGLSKRRNSWVPPRPSIMPRGSR